MVEYVCGWCGDGEVCVCGWSVCVWSVCVWMKCVCGGVCVWIVCVDDVCEGRGWRELEGA